MKNNYGERMKNWCFLSHVLPVWCEAHLIHLLTVRQLTVGKHCTAMTSGKPPQLFLFWHIPPLPPIQQIQFFFLTAEKRCRGGLSPYTLRGAPQSAVVCWEVLGTRCKQHMVPLPRRAAYHNVGITWRASEWGGFLWSWCLSKWKKKSRGRLGKKRSKEHYHGKCRGGQIFLFAGLILKNLKCHGLMLN